MVNLTIRQHFVFKNVNGRNYRHDNLDNENYRCSIESLSLMHIMLNYSKKIRTDAFLANSACLGIAYCLPCARLKVL